MSLERLTAKRTWFVPDILVWGEPSVGEIDFLACEGLGGADRVYYGTASTGDSVQTIEFNQLTDHRGNQLPSQLTSPRVIIRQRTTTPVFVVGAESDTHFCIARDPGATGPVTADLFIIEMGA